MNKLLFSSILFFGIAIISQAVSAQSIKSFSHDSIVFQDEFLKFMDHPTKKKEFKEFKEQFPTFWFSPEMTSEKRSNIYQICDIFLNKKARSFPDFYNYFETLMLFQQQNRDQKDYSSWEKGLLLQMSDRKNKLSATQDFLIQTQNLLRDTILHESYATKWKCENANFKFLFDKELTIQFDKADLYCIAQRDSSCIYSTSGIYHPFEKIWKGKKGKVTWTRAGKSSADEYATFDSYSVDTEKSSFQVDTVSYYNKELFDSKIEGSLSEKMNSVKDPALAIYPRFESFGKEIEIKNLFTNLNYKGGIAIHGAKFLGKGSPEFPSVIELSRHDTLFLRARSEHFSFNNNRVVGKDTEIEILIDTCQIYHPGLLFQYYPDKKEVNLIRDGEGIALSPYFNTYHNIIMDFGMLIWNMDENLMHFGSMKGATSRQAHFESMNYFSLNRFMKIQGMDQENPLVSLRKYADYCYVETFTAMEYANFIKKPVNQVRQQIIGLSFQGFVIYDRNTDEVSLQQRLTDYIKSGMGRQDYDVIRFTTQTENNEDDATLRMGSFNLDINGVKHIAVSDSQNVVIFPKHQKITLKKNRDFQFDGKIMAGLLDMYGKDFNFSYEKFKIDLDLIDSLQINIVNDSLSTYGRRYTTQLGSVLEKITGNLLIDDPNNKSGMNNYDEYPIFNSSDSCFVYYDSKKIQDGVYKKEEFYFKVDPYTINNINDFKKEDISLKGEFVSDSIFPTFRETLSINDDNSLGFYHLTPATGFSAYGKGTFTDTIHLSNEGLIGNGVLNYLSSTTKSKNFVFRPEVMTTQAESFELKELASQMNNPEVNGEKIFETWYPYKEELYVKSTALPIDMYKKLATLAGTLKITPKEITGVGDMELVNAELQSDYFTYTPKTIIADTASFKLKNTDAEGYAFESTDVKALIDFRNRTGQFTSTTEGSISEFPSNKYIAYINSFGWEMDKQELLFGSESETTLASLWEQNKMETLPETAYTKLISTSIKQDSLSFFTPLARYSSIEHTIKAKYVSDLAVADAKIYPDKGEVNIENEGLMQTLRNSKVLADTINSYHNIFNATINVHGKNSYSGSGSYTYFDADDKEQDLVFDVIDVDSLGQTIAMGNLPEEESFSLSPDFDYKGKVKLEAREKSLFFNGQTKIHNHCESIDDNWLEFNSQIDPKEIYIPVELYVTDDESLKLYNSFFLTNDSIHIYSSFLSRRIFYTDNVLLEAKGFLTYKPNLQAYQIAPKDKLKDLDASGSILSFYQGNCNMRGEGLINLGAELGQIKQIASGAIEHNLASDIVTLDLIFGVDYFMNDQAMKIMENAFMQANLKRTNINKQDYTRKLAEIMGRKKAELAVREMDDYGTFKSLPNELLHTIYFNNLDFIWNKETKAYQSIGEIGIGNINDKQINKSIKGKIELDKKRSGNRLTMYLEIDNSTWFYFEYHHGVMFVRSSNEEFNTLIHESKEDKREFKDPLKKNPYSYIICPRSQKTKFLKEFNME
ncbi:hypothetical protein BZG02_05800 [Labilibaculum filiforme]|uniref:Uncharacterized protein n=1 Tax=Labilibaculum filiforme TaxID=1940526 RepID=A0A2N3I1Y4_9BACT|nr:hypothetical protein [Labilibaculum filiforme]PKQ64329.1 hypothetical protein BZG02_05800 [Labilibaculum filiforme]